MKIAVAGGTGLTGRNVVQVLTDAGHDPVVLSRARDADLLTGAGLDTALAGVDTVIDVSNVTTMKRDVAVGFFDAAGRNLLDAATRAGVQHLVALSIVGIDRVDSPYYAGKIRQEEIVMAGTVPWTILRATQFHEFAGQMLERLPGPVALMPAMKTQPIAVREVAEALATLSTQPPQGRTPDLAGPHVEPLVTMARRLIAAGGARHRRVIPVPVPGPMSNGGLLPTGPGPRGTQTFDEWITARAFASS